MRGIFLTQVTTRRAGGLGGAIATIAKTVHSLNVIGPPGVRHFLASMRGFIRGLIGLSLIEHTPQMKPGIREVAYRDENITVYSFPVTRQPIVDQPLSEPSGGSEKVKNPKDVFQAGKAKTALGLSGDEVRAVAIYHMFKENLSNAPPEFLEDEPIADDNERWIPNWLHAKQLPSFAFPKTFPQSSTLAYVVVGPRPVGPSSWRFDGEKIAQSNLDVGSLLKFVYGGTRQLDNDIDGPDTVLNGVDIFRDLPAPVVIILDIPEIDLIPSVLCSFDNEYKCFRASAFEHRKNHTVNAVYHLLGPGVIYERRYIDFMSGFPPSTQHFITCPEYSPDTITFPNHAYRQQQLTQLDPEVFPLPQSRTPRKAGLHRSGLVLPRTQLMRTGVQIRLDIPHRPHMYSLGSPVRSQYAILNKMPLREGTMTAFKGARITVSRHPDVSRKDRRIPVKVLCLGTGKSMPDQYRNVSSTLLMTPDGHIMLDCGEGAFGQLTRRFGRGTRHILGNIKCIFISHAHADHHLGLLSLLRQRRLLSPTPEQPLYVVATRFVHLFLKEYHELEDIGLCDDPAKNGVVQILNDALNYRLDEYPSSGLWRLLGTEPWLDMDLSRNHNLDMCKSLNLESFETIDVFHRTRAFGALIRHNDGWSVAFSGDTMPTINLVKLGYGADLLIHEATLPHGADDIAQERSHSTTGQAIQVAREMNAKNVLLTHLPTPTISLPPHLIAELREDTDAWDEPLVAVAYDLMEIDLDKMWKANIYIPAIVRCYRDSKDQEKKSLGELLFDLDPSESSGLCAS